LTASPPVSGMLNPIVIGAPDGASARTGLAIIIAIIAMIDISTRARVPNMLPSPL
jgi:hypothetical protein